MWPELYTRLHAILVERNFDEDVIEDVLRHICPEISNEIDKAESVVPEPDPYVVLSGSDGYAVGEYNEVDDV